MRIVLLEFVTTLPYVHETAKFTMSYLFLRLIQKKLILFNFLVVTCVFDNSPPYETET